MRKLTVNEITTLHIKGGDWGVTVSAVCTVASSAKYGFGIGNNLVSGFCLGWGISKLIYK